MTSKAVYPGTFDPFTNGHLDITQRGARIFDELTVAVSADSVKSATFSVEERQMMIREAAADIPNVRVVAFEGLLVDFMRREHSRVILRGLRALSDFEYEFQFAQMNKQLAPETETFFIVTDAKYSYLSSRSVKEIFQLGGSIREFVPPVVLRRIEAHDAPPKKRKDRLE
ncbi:MAG: pantetheine-phosphate adenylyltransferase [Synergistaceae bacterium]|jgi:pantetheine-phosphate adenylyltransferase|nr:pantetheine-phosphate adenylyltransferase [Synergistaceae bacterium]